MQFKNLATTTAIFMAAILPVSVLATHAIGDPCTKAKYQDTTGCSSDGCNIVRCVLEPNGGGAYYWAENGTCSGLGMCNNGVCNGDVDESKSCAA